MKRKLLRSIRLSELDDAEGGGWQAELTVGNVAEGTEDDPLEDGTDWGTLWTAEAAATPEEALATLKKAVVRQDNGGPLLWPEDGGWPGTENPSEIMPGEE